MARVLNAEERAAKEEVERKEAERLALEQQDDFRVRGVQQVMCMVVSRAREKRR